MRKVCMMAILPLLLTSAGSALTINDALRNVVNTNPEIRERIENYRSIEEDRKIAYSGHLPVIDAEVGYGYRHYDGTIPGFSSDDWRYTEAFIRARENLFHGFGIQNDVEQQDKRLVSAEYYLMEKVSQLGLDMIEKYLEVLKNKRLLDLAIENRKIHEKYYKKIKDRVKSGVGTEADFEQISGRLALAESNVRVAENNLMDAKINFYRIYGSFVKVNQMHEGKINGSRQLKRFFSEDF